MIENPWDHNKYEITVVFSPETFLDLLNLAQANLVIKRAAFEEAARLDTDFMTSNSEQFKKVPQNENLRKAALKARNAFEDASYLLRDLNNFKAKRFEGID